MAGESECAIGEPSTAARSGMGSRALRLGQHVPALAWHQAWNSWTYWSCSCDVSANFVSPVFGLTVTQKSHGPSAGLRAAWIADALGLPMGPAGSPALT